MDIRPIQKKAFSITIHIQVVCTCILVPIGVHFRVGNMAIGKMGSKKIFRDPNLTIPRTRYTGVRGIAKPYKYKTKRTARLDPDYATPTAVAAEVLTGYVRGEEASDLEERFAIALDEAKLTYVFQYAVYSAYSLPGEEQIIDFIVYDGGTPYPIETGSRFVHGYQSQIERDRERDQILNEILKYRGFQEIYRIEFDHPEDLDDARQIVQELFG